MIIPSNVHIARDRELADVVERAETPPGYSHSPRTNVPPSLSAQPQAEDADIDDAILLAASQSGSNAELIKLCDREEASDQRPMAETILKDGCEVSLGTKHSGQEPRLDESATGPRVFRKDAMVGVTDTMCATGKPSHIYLHTGSSLIRLFALSPCILSSSPSECPTVISIFRLLKGCYCLLSFRLCCVSANVMWTL